MNNKLGLYIHIPFCERKCNYCSFLSFPLGENTRREYVDVLIEEIKNNGKVLGNDFVVDTVFIGGGTPSLLEPELIGKILDTVREYFNLDSDVEITMESNPNSLDELKLMRYRKYGINRLSIGIQSFDDKVLKTLGRVHNSYQAVKAYYAARNAGFENINIDLMFGIPGQNEAVWHETMEKAIELNPDHISFYSLQIEEGTPFYNDYKNEKLPFVENSLMDNMYNMAVKRFKDAGYVHYEISNTSKKGKSCRHNIKYWKLEPFLGFGAGASSYINGFRCENPDDLEHWKSLVLSNDAGYEEVEIHTETREEAMSVFVFTGLRMVEGIDLNLFKDKFDVSFESVYKEKMEYLKNMENEGYLEMSKDRIRLTEKGILISNDIMCEFV